MRTLRQPVSVSACAARGAGILVTSLACPLGENCGGVCPLIAGHLSILMNSMRRCCWRLQALVGGDYDGDGFFDLACGDLGVYGARHLAYFDFSIVHTVLARGNV